MTGTQRGRTVSEKVKTKPPTTNQQVFSAK